MTFFLILSVLGTDDLCSFWVLPVVENISQTCGFPSLPWLERLVDKYRFPVIDPGVDFNEEWEELWPGPLEQVQSSLLCMGRNCLRGFYCCLQVRRVWTSPWSEKSHEGQSSHWPHLYCLFSLFTHLGRKSFTFSYCYLSMWGCLTEGKKCKALWDPRFLFWNLFIPWMLISWIRI